MSQINDALRRAGHIAHANQNAAPMVPPMPAAAPPLPLPPPPIIPGMAAGESGGSKSTVIQIVLASLLVVSVTIAAAVNFWEKRNRSNADAKPSSAAGAKKTLPMEATKANPSLPAPNSTSSVTISNPAPASAATTTTNIKAPVVSAPPAPSHPVEPVKFPPLRLQSIFFRPSNPSVIINNKTLYVDDQIQGVLVADIQPASVTLVLSGQTNILTLR